MMSIKFINSQTLKMEIMLVERT